MKHQMKLTPLEIVRPTAPSRRARARARFRTGLTVRFEEVGIGDVAHVGGKNASLGEMIGALAAKGVRVPSGFIVTADAYRYFLKADNLEKFIRVTLKGLNTHNVTDLALRGSAIRAAVRRAPFPKDMVREIEHGYAALEKRYGKNADV